MIEIFLELLALFFGKKSYKKIKKWFDKTIKKKDVASKKLQKERNKAIVWLEE